MKMSIELTRFIEENISIIEEETEESYKLLYQKADNKLINTDIGLLTTLLLSVGRDPARVMKKLVVNYLNGSNIDTYTIPDSCRTIPAFSFASCSNLESVVIPNTVERIGMRAFEDCKSLNTIVFSENITRIVTNAFTNCTLLTTVTIEDRDTLLELHSSIFYNCTNLKLIVFNGTKDKLERVVDITDQDWSYGSNITKILCTDGAIELR